MSNLYIFLLILILFTIKSLAWDHYSYDSDNFMCDYFDEFCDNILDELGCSNNASDRLMLGCKDNKVEDYVGTCTCLSPFVLTNPGKRVTSQLISNRIKSVIEWNLQPYKKGPPYDLVESFTPICDLYLDRINCPVANRTNVVNNYKIVDGQKLPDYSCNCGKLTEGSDYILYLMYDKFNDYTSKSHPVFSDPLYFSLPLSIALLLVVGKIFAIVAVYFSLPPVIGFLFAGVAIQNYMNPLFLKGPGFPFPAPAAEIKNIALIIVFIRAGLSLKLREIQHNWLPTICLFILPFIVEFITWIFVGPSYYDFSTSEMGAFASLIAPLGPSIIITASYNLIQDPNLIHGYPIKQSLIACPFESILSVVFFDTFSNLLEKDRSTMYPWVDPLPDYVPYLLIPVNIIFSCVLGFVFGYFASKYISWRSHIKTDYIWTRVNKNKQLGSNTPEFVFIIFVLSYLMLSLAQKQYIPCCSGYLIIYAAAVTISLDLDDEKSYSIAASMKGIWVFGEVFMLTITGTSLSFDSSNGPLQGQNGLDGDEIKKLMSMLFIGFSARYAALLVILFFLQITFPKHRRNFRWIFLFSIVMIIMQMPKATIQATLGSLPYNLHLIPGDKGQKKSKIIYQCTAFSVLIFAPIGTILINHIASPLSCYLTSLDEEAGWIYNEYKYHIDSPYYDPNISGFVPDDIEPYEFDQIDGEDDPIQDEAIELGDINTEVDEKKDQSVPPPSPFVRPQFPKSLSRAGSGLNIARRRSMSRQGSGLNLPHGLERQGSSSIFQMAFHRQNSTMLSAFEEDEPLHEQETIFDQIFGNETTNTPSLISRIKHFRQASMEHFDTSHHHKSTKSEED